MPVQSPEPQPTTRRDPYDPQPTRAQHVPGYWGERLAWISGLVLTISAFTDWYAGTQADGLTLSVTGWQAGALGKLVFFIGLAILILEALREAGIELPPSVPEQIVVIALGALASIFVLFRLASIPDTYFAAAGRGIGVYVALLAAFGLVAAGLLRLAANPPRSERHL